MLLAIDIGNTSITFGLFKHSSLRPRTKRGGSNLKKVFRIPTKLNTKNTKLQLKKNLKAYNVDSIIICSVVPKKTTVLQRVLKQLFKINPKVIGKDIRIPIKNLYKKPKQVGQDRLVAAYACREFYGVPAVIIDFGTAITFDYINKKGEYCGGIITPGIEISLDALFERTALLPKVIMKAPADFLGKSTAESIRSGVAYGLSSMCDGLIEGFKKRFGRNLKIVATGGFSDFFKKRCKSITIVDKNIILKGLHLIYNKFFS